MVGAQKGNCDKWFCYPCANKYRDGMVVVVLFL